MDDKIIEIKNLSKSYLPSKGECKPVHALKNIFLSIPRNSIYGIIGMSGAGKSTLLRCLIGLDSPSEGAVFFENEILDGSNSDALLRFRRQMGMVFQHFQLFSSRTVGNNIGYPLEILGIPFTQRQKRIRELLLLVGLEAKINHYPSQLSGGEKQRVGIARALASHPRLLFCDEPTSALDSKTTQDLLELLQRLNRDLGLTIIMITHDLQTVKQICDRVAILCKGEIVEEGKVKDIFMQPQHSSTQRLLQPCIEKLACDLSISSLTGKKIVRLAFQGERAKQPILSHMLKNYHVEANILSGCLDQLQETVVGHLIIELSGPAEEMKKAFDYLKNQHVICKVLS